MAPNIASAKITLSCPLFAAGFDPCNNGLLLAGGGGGESRSGVTNKIALLNVSKPSDISEIIDIELSRNEDSVMSLAVALSDEDTLVALAGINSSQEEQQRGNNQHLRSFKLELPLRKSSMTKALVETNQQARKTIPLSRASLFRSTAEKSTPKVKIDTYQRLLRLSPWNNENPHRICAIATGLAPSGEIVLFTVTASPQPSDVIGRIQLGSGEEAEDVDIVGMGNKKFKVAYTNGLEVFTFDISSSRKSEACPEVSFVCSVPLTSPNQKTRPKFRALRFLSPTALALLQNSPNGLGCELVILSLSSSKAHGKIIARWKLPRSVKVGFGLDVCELGENTEKERQFIIAASGSDLSIRVFTLEYNPRKGYDKLRPYTTFQDVHPFSITSICFSVFPPPPHSDVTGDHRPQYVKLASTSMGTVVVHTFPLSLFPATSSQARYVLAGSKRPQVIETIYSCFVALLIIGLSCFLLQAFAEIRGGSPAYLGATDWLPERVRDVIARPYMLEHSARGLSDHFATPAATITPVSYPTPYASPSEQPVRTSLRELLAHHHEGNNDDAATLTHTVTIIIRDEGASVSIDIHRGVVPSTEDVRRWEDLYGEEREQWKQRLQDAGHWAVEEGEQILEGILFGRLAAVVGDAI